MCLSANTTFRHLQAPPPQPTIDTEAAFRALSSAVDKAQNLAAKKQHHLQTCQNFHNDLVNLLASYESLICTHPLAEELDQLHRLTDLIADKIFPHNHEQ